MSDTPLTMESILGEQAPFALESWRSAATTDIYFNSNRSVWTQGEKYVKLGALSRDALYRTISALGTAISLKPSQRRLVPSGVMSDRTRVQVAAWPVAIGDDRSCSAACRKPPPKDTTLDQLSSLSSIERRYLKDGARHRMSVGFVGGQGSGKTTALRAFCNAHAPYQEDRRIVAIDDAGELECILENFESYRTTDLFDSEAFQALSMDALAAVALRTGSDIVMFGEIRTAAVAVELLNALNTGHPGSSATWHANSARDAIVRLERLAARTGAALSAREIASLFDAVMFCWKDVTFESNSVATISRQAIVARVVLTQDDFVLEAVDPAKQRFVERTMLADRSRASIRAVK